MSPTTEHYKRGRPMMKNKVKRARKKPSSGSSSKKPPVQPAHLWTRPITWLVAILIAALGVAVTNWLVPRFTDLIEGFLATGDPVVVQVSEDLNLFPIALPSRVRMSDSLLAELSQLPVQDQRSRLEDLGGLPQGSGTIAITVTGNRADEVRITNIRPIVECRPPDPGTLVYTELGAGGAVDSTVMYLTVDESSPVPFSYNQNMEKAPFFPAKTIALKQDEQVVIVVHAFTDNLTCSFELDMAVLVGNETRNQRIKNGDKPFLRAPYLEDEQFQQVYYGGNVCKKYTKQGSESSAMQC